MHYIKTDWYQRLAPVKFWYQWHDTHAVYWCKLTGTGYWYQKTGQCVWPFRPTADKVLNILTDGLSVVMYTS